MTPEDGLQLEAVRLARYVLGTAPSDRLVAAYSDPRVHDQIPGPRDSFDRILLGSVALGPMALRVADTYARVFRPAAWLRRRLILLIALAEVHGEDAGVFKEPLSGGVVSFFAQAGARGSVTVICFLIGLAVLGPVHVTTMLARWRP